MLAAALRAATPPTPALMLAVGMRAVRAGDWKAALRGVQDAIALEPVGARDDDARLDAAALVFVLAAERGDAGDRGRGAARAGRPTSATAAFWRGEALQARGGGRRRRRPWASSRCASSRRWSREDPRLPKLRAPTRGAARRRCGGCSEARDALEAGPAEAAVRAARAALATPELAELGAAQAFLAEALNAAARARRRRRPRRRATEINPTWSTAGGSSATRSSRRAS